ncbi:MAG: putative membrane protein, partial [Paraglaciecola sp.]
RQQLHTRQQIVSNVFSLIAFMSLLIGGDIAIALLAVSYILLLVYENKLSKKRKPDSLTSDYITMRFWLTLSVVLLHIGALILWYD